MSTCTVCHHTSKLAMEAELRSSDKIAWRSMAAQYGVHHLALLSHKRAHMDEKPAVVHEHIMRETLDSVDTRIPPVDESVESSSMTIQKIRKELSMVLVDDHDSMTLVAETGMGRLKLVLPEVQAAFRMAAGDHGMQERMRFLVNEAIQADDMGL